MRKERRQHVGIFHHAKKLGMVAQFHEVIRGRCGGRGEPERNGMAGLDQLGAVIPIGRFKDAALIQNDRDELRQVEMRSEEHTSELQSIMRISYTVFCLKKKKSHKK